MLRVFRHPEEPNAEIEFFRDLILQQQKDCENSRLEVEKIGEKQSKYKNILLELNSKRAELQSDIAELNRDPEEKAREITACEVLIAHINKKENKIKDRLSKLFLEEKNWASRIELYLKIQEFCQLLMNNYSSNKDPELRPMVENHLDKLIYLYFSHTNNHGYIHQSRVELALLNSESIMEQNKHRLKLRICKLESFIQELEIEISLCKIKDCLQATNKYHEYSKQKMIEINALKDYIVALKNFLALIDPLLEHDLTLLNYIDQSLHHLQSVHYTSETGYLYKERLNVTLLATENIFEQQILKIKIMIEDFKIAVSLVTLEQYQWQIEDRISGINELEDSSEIAVILRFKILLASVSLALEQAIKILSQIKDNEEFLAKQSVSGDIVQLVQKSKSKSYSEYILCILSVLKALLELNLYINEQDQSDSLNDCQLKLNEFDELHVDYLQYHMSAYSTECAAEFVIPADLCFDLQSICSHSKIPSTLIAFALDKCTKSASRWEPVLAMFMEHCQNLAKHENESDSGSDSGMGFPPPPPPTTPQLRM